MDFRARLAGGLILFWVAANSEIYRYDFWLVRSLASLPLALTLCLEFYRTFSLNWKQILVAVLIGAPLLGQLGMIAKDSSGHLFRLLGDYENEALLTGEPVYEVRDVGFGDGDQSVVDLPRKADIQLDSSIRFFLKTGSIKDYLALTRSPLYVRTSTVAIFEGDERLGPIRKGQWIFDSDDGVDDSVTTIPERAGTQPSSIPC